MKLLVCYFGVRTPLRRSDWQEGGERRTWTKCRTPDTVRDLSLFGTEHGRRLICGTDTEDPLDLHPVRRKTPGSDPLDPLLAHEGAPKQETLALGSSWLTSARGDCLFQETGERTRFLPHILVGHLVRKLRLPCTRPVQSHPLALSAMWFWSLPRLHGLQAR